MDSELQEESVIRDFRITATDGKSYDTKHYNLSATIAVGYKVNSERAVQSRKWATRAADGDTWRHTRIRLTPNNPAFAPIELAESDEGAVQVIAELIEVRGTAAPDR